MSNNFTPGPWYFENTDGGKGDTGEGLQVCDEPTGMIVCEIEHSDTTEADARLIATAPEMHELITRYVEINGMLESASSREAIDLCEELSELFDKFVAVLKKARGEA